MEFKIKITMLFTLGLPKIKLIYKSKKICTMYMVLGYKTDHELISLSEALSMRVDSEVVAIQKVTWDGGHTILCHFH